MAVGTCSWSNVSTSAPTAARRSASRSVCSPITTSGRDLRGRVVRTDGEDAQALAERDRGLVGHPGQLSAANHGDHRRSGACRHGHHGVMSRPGVFTGGDQRDYAHLRRFP